MTRVLLFWHDSKHYSTLSFLYGMTGELQMEAQANKGMISTRVELIRNEVAGQSEGPIGTLKIGVKSATELEIF